MGHVVPPPLFAIADIHGDLEKAHTALRLCGLVNGEHAWSGANATLVQMGDLVDRGQDSLKVLRLFWRLKEAALLAGGRVVTLLGNHEVRLRMHARTHARKHSSSSPGCMHLRRRSTSRATSATSTVASWRRRGRHGGKTLSTLSTANSVLSCVSITKRPRYKRQPRMRGAFCSQVNECPAPLTRACALRPPTAGCGPRAVPNAVRPRGPPSRVPP